MTTSTELRFNVTCWADGWPLEYETEGVTNLTASAITGRCTNPECDCVWLIEARIKRAS